MAIDKIIMYTDGCSRRNPGPAIGVVIKSVAGQTLATVSRRIGEATNNQAEYKAIIAGLEKALAMSASMVEIRSDSQLVVEQLNGRYRVKDADLKPLFQKVQELHWKFAGFQINYIPREQNREADKLANQAFRQTPPGDELAGSNTASRPATIEDYPELFDIYDEIEAQHSQALPHIFKTLLPSARKPYLDMILTSENDVLLVAVIDHHIAGFLQIGLKDTSDIPVMVSRTYAKISDLAVKKEFQRRGVGTALMGGAEKWARSRRAVSLELMVWEFNKGARSFYKTAGYETIARIESKDLDR